MIMKGADIGQSLGVPSLPLYYYGGNAYYFQTFSTATRGEANLFCTNLNMSLVRIESKLENDFLFKTIESLVDYETADFWTGGLKNGNIWYWESTGKAFSFTHWSSAIHSSSGTCLEVIHSSDNNTMFWSPNDCSLKNYVICEGADDGGIPS
ncbi:hypothetical protein JTB14_033032 [Gonioctena quinquepunctata]|nr:hypothetical protein JTB14_033032 [Gonioctena quinquepunctata]